MIQFQEVFRCSGVDHDIRNPGMIIPFGGSNVVAVRHERQKINLTASTSAIRVEELNPSLIRTALDNIDLALSKPDVDHQRRAAYAPNGDYQHFRYFLIRGQRRVNFPGAKLQVHVQRSVPATLPVVVVDPITVRIAIRAVQIYDDSGMLRNHCSEAVDPPTELDRMNKIWTPQAQIKFELVPSQPAIINDRNPVIQKVIADGLGLKDTSLARVPAIVEASKLKELFRPLKVSGAQATFFIVDRIADGEGRPNGITFADDAMIYIARSRDQSTFAHEAGHFLGRKHTSEMIYNERTKQFVLADEDYRMLMRDGGAGAKIPFNLIREFRSRCSQGSERK